MKKRAQTKALGVVLFPGRNRPVTIPLSWSLLYAGSVVGTICICLVLNFLFVLYPARMSEYSLLVAGGTTHLSQLLEQQVAYTRSEIRNGEESLEWMNSVSKDLETQTAVIRKTLQIDDPNVITLSEINSNLVSPGYAAVQDPHSQATKLGFQIKDIVSQTRLTLDLIANDKRQSQDARWFQNHTPNRWPVPDPYEFVRPGVPGKRDLTPGFGNRINPISFMAEFHTGIDVDGDMGEPKYAVADGVVTMAKWSGGYGMIVEILHRNDSGGIKTRYGHCSEMLVKEGDTVVRGQVIALIGSTGYSTGPHIHFELMIGHEFYDAGEYIRTAIQSGIKGDDLTIPKPEDKTTKQDNSKTNPANTKSPATSQSKNKDYGEKHNVP